LASADRKPRLFGHNARQAQEQADEFVNLLWFCSGMSFAQDFSCQLGADAGIVRQPPHTTNRGLRW